MREKLTAITIFDGQRLNAFPLKSAVRQGYLTLPLLFNIVMESLVKAVRPRKGYSGHSDWKGRNKTRSCTQKILRNSLKKLLEQINESRIQDQYTKVNFTSVH